MNKNILNYIEECEAWKVGIKNLHWSADNLSQHELCDDIASEISDFEDLVSEVEQSISGKIKLNGFTPKSYKITSLKSFVEDVISASQDFLKKLDGMGEKYVGIKSECETFIGTMQRKLYLVNFTLKEELKERIKAKINEGYRKEENIKTIFPGTKPSSDSGILKRLDAISSGKNGQFNSRTFDSMEDAFKFFKRNLEKVGSLEYKDTVDDMIIVSLNADNGKTYKGMIDFIEVGDGKYKASIKFSNLGKELYDELEDKKIRNESIDKNNFMNRWFDKNEEEHLDKARKGLNGKLYKSSLEKLKKMTPDVRNSVEEGNEIRLTEAELKQVVKEATINLIQEYDMAMAAHRGIENGSSHAHELAMYSLGLNGSGPEDFEEYQNELEALDAKNENKEVKLSELELKEMVKNSIVNILEAYSYNGINYLEKKQHEGITESKEKKPIKIAKEKEGTFKREATKHGKTPKQFAKEVLNSPEGKFSPLMRKKANFCNNFAK
jgi:hypothetical protein